MASGGIVFLLFGILISFAGDGLTFAFDAFVSFLSDSTDDGSLSDGLYFLQPGLLVCGRCLPLHAGHVISSSV